MSKDNHKKVIIIGIVIIVLLLIGVAFAYLTTTPHGEKEYLVRAGSLGLRLEEGNKLTEWYSDYRTMVSEIYPWLVRGGSYTTDNNVSWVFGFFANGWGIGSANTNGSFRLVISSLK